MKQKLGMLLVTSAMFIGPAAAQDAASLLQAANRAIGASAVNSVVYSGTGWMGYPGQSFATGDLPRTDLKSYTLTVDYASNPRKRTLCAFRGTISLAAAAQGFRSKASRK
jgi:hypothetical protein